MADAGDDEIVACGSALLFCAYLVIVITWRI